MELDMSCGKIYQFWFHWVKYYYSLWDVVSTRQWREIAIVKTSEGVRERECKIWSVTSFYQVIVQCSGELGTSLVFINERDWMQLIGLS